MSALSRLTAVILLLCSLFASDAMSAETAPRRAQGPSPARYGMALQEAAIAMADGTKLAADLWMPTGGAAGERFPVLLEYLPYRKDESRGDRYGVYSYFVNRGYVVARVDIRGTGRSEGRLIAYEYTDEEQSDGEAVIAWLAAQPFSNGKVGMFGISWGGFNSIHMAMRSPPALKAIIAIEAADDLYEDDVHYIDGMMHVDSYEFEMDIENAMPGAPDYRIDEAYFRDRFDTTPWFLVYKKEQRDGPFWDRTSPNAHYERIRTPAFLIGGWYDGYRDSIPRMLEHVKAPVKAMIGPWSHDWPSSGFPDVPVEWRHEAVRWFDHWLKGRDTGIMDEPRFAVYVRDWHPPGTDVEKIPGRWRWEDGWPIERTDAWTLYPGGDDRGLAPKPPRAQVDRLRYQPSVGVEAGGPVMWYGDLGWDQRPADAMSLVYETPPLEQDVEILGFPRARLKASVDAPLAYWFVRLSDVAPTGEATLVAAAGVNGAHRESAAAPEALEPDRAYAFDVELHATSWVFPAGHRIRMAVNNAQWPMIWPTPYAMTASLHLGGADATRLILPVIPHEGRDAPVFVLPGEDPKLAGYGEYDSETPSGYAEIGVVERDYLARTARAIAKNAGTMSYPWGKVRYEEEIVHSTDDRHPERTAVKSKLARTVTLADRVLRFEGVLDFHSDATSFHYAYTRRLLQDGELVRERKWEESFPRDHH
jgi:putative CocE/NonD family hydrolase